MSHTVVVGVPVVVADLAPHRNWHIEVPCLLWLLWERAIAKVGYSQKSGFHVALKSVFFPFSEVPCLMVPHAFFEPCQVLCFFFLYNTVDWFKDPKPRKIRDSRHVSTLRRTENLAKYVIHAVFQRFGRLKDSQNT